MARWQDNKITELELENRRLTEERDNFRATSDQRAKATARLHRQVADLTQTKSEDTRILNEYKGTNSSLARMQRQLQSEIDQLQSDDLAKDQSIKDLQAQLEEAGTRTNAVQSELWEAQATIESYEEANRVLQEALDGREGDAPAEDINPIMDKDEPAAHPVTEDTLVAAGGWSAPATNTYDWADVGSPQEDTSVDEEDEGGNEEGFILNGVDLTSMLNTFQFEAVELMTASLDFNLGEQDRTRLQHQANNVFLRAVQLNAFIKDQESKED